MYCDNDIYDFLAKLSEKLIEKKTTFCSSNELHAQSDFLWTGYNYTTVM